LQKVTVDGLDRPYSGVRLLICILLVKVQSARSNAEEKPYENRIVAAASSLLV
jgi:hypothetical protein